MLHGHALGIRDGFTLTLLVGQCASDADRTLWLIWEVRELIMFAVLTSLHVWRYVLLSFLRPGVLSMTSACQPLPLSAYGSVV